MKYIHTILVTTLLFIGFRQQAISSSDNQTDQLSPILSEDSLPFSLQIDTAPFGLPTGLQSFAFGIYDGKWVMISGRTNGLHGFDNIGNNFPPNYQNTNVYVLDPTTGESWSRSLTEPSAFLTQEEIDTLSVTANQYFQKGRTLYLVGGYGINTATGDMETKSTLTAVDLKRIIRWVIYGNEERFIRQTSHPYLQVTGGFLFQTNDHEPFLLMLGQNFVGYYRDNTNGIYTEQIRAFWIIDDGKHLSIIPKDSPVTFPDYRRRDLNILPVIRKNQFAYVAFAGVFTLNSGVWTVPITIFPDGSSYEPDPSFPKTFKQAMNHYNCPTFGIYSTRSEEMFAIFPGGISYGYIVNGGLQVDSEVPFINQMTTVRIDKNDNYTQHLMNNEYPYIVSTGTNPGNQLLFGAEAQFFPKDGISLYTNGVIQMDALPKEPTVIGYIVGGIMSTLPNTNTRADSTTSPYIFTVTYIPKGVF